VAVLGVTIGRGEAAIAAAPQRPPALDIRAGALFEASTGQRLYAMNPDRELAIASATKIMTALVTLQQTRLSQVFTDPPFYLAPADSQIGLLTGQRMDVHDLLIALLLPSADDAAEDLAYGVGHGSVSRFVAMMNAEAARLGLRHTHYSTPIGLDTPGNYSTAGDLVTLTRYVMRTQPFFRHVTSLPRASIRVGPRSRLVMNLNTLVGRVRWVTGVKTGHTIDAGYVLVGSGTRDGMTLISAVLGAPSETARESDTLALLRYGFDAFRLTAPVTAGAVLARRPETGFPGRQAELIAGGTVRRVLRRGALIRVRVRAPKHLTGPLRANSLIGSAEVLADGRLLARIPLRLRSAVAAPPAGMLTWLGPGGVTLLLVGLSLTAGGLFRLRRRSHRQASPAPSQGSA
jgi:serine-type D-Ala-D-Ala carboxypeptidase (penicillin-binding protein 5/6)